MSARIFIITLSSILIGAILPAAAAVEERDAPNNMTVWIFLGFCALIIIAQIGTLIMGPTSRKISKDMSEHEKEPEHSKVH
ncbi:MAG: hypothetical protein ABSA86_10400 [Oryzomonas sp.]|jgi:uncharacterized membrane protein YjfL (UPF0719 family)